MKSNEFEVYKMGVLELQTQDALLE